MPEDFLSWLQLALAILGGASMLATPISKLTPWEADDRAANWLRKVVDRLSLLQDRVGTGAAGKSGDPPDE